jgi:Amidohydrolase family/DoxX
MAAETAPPIRRMLKSCVPVSAGTDATRVSSYNPWVSLYWLVTGRTVGGLQIRSEGNCLDRETALRMWTESVTWFSDEVGKKGLIMPGMLADLIVPDRDYFSCADAEIADITSILTVVDGRIVYAAGDFSSLDDGGPPPALPDWSPVATFGGYGAWKSSPSARRIVAPPSMPQLDCCPHGQGPQPAVPGGLSARELNPFGVHSVARVSRSSVATAHDSMPSITTYGLAVARVMLAVVFLYSGQDKLRHWRAGVAEVASLGLPFAGIVAGATVAVQIVGGILVAFGIGAHRRRPPGGVYDRGHTSRPSFLAATGR